MARQGSLFTMQMDKGKDISLVYYALLIIRLYAMGYITQFDCRHVFQKMVYYVWIIISFIQNYLKDMAL